MVVEDHGQDVGLAGQAADLVGGEPGPVIELAPAPDPQLVPQDRHLGQRQDDGAGPVLGDHIGAPGPAGHLHRSVGQDLTEAALLVEGQLGLPVGALHLRRGVPDRPVEHGVGLVVQLQNGPAQSVLGPGADQPCAGGAAAPRGTDPCRGPRRGRGPSPSSGPGTPSAGNSTAQPMISSASSSRLSAVRAVGVIGQDPGVIEPDPALRPRHPRLGQGRRAGGPHGPGSGRWPGRCRCSGAARPRCPGSSPGPGPASLRPRSTTRPLRPRADPGAPAGPSPARPARTDPAKAGPRRDGGAVSPRARSDGNISSIVAAGCDRNKEIQGSFGPRRPHSSVVKALR